MNMVKSTKDKAKDSFNSFSRLFIRAQLINNEIRQTKGEDEKEVKPPPPNYYQPGGQKAAPQQQAQTQKQPVRPAQRPQQSAPKESANNIEDLFDTDGPRNGQGVLWEQLVYEEKKYHGVELITNMDCVMDELENVIPNMKKGGNDDMNDELDDKEMMQTQRKNVVIRGNQMVGEKQKQFFAGYKNDLKQQQENTNTKIALGRREGVSKGTLDRLASRLEKIKGEIAYFQQEDGEEPEPEPPKQETKPKPKPKVADDVATSEFIGKKPEQTRMYFNL